MPAADRGKAGRSKGVRSQQPLAGAARHGGPAPSGGLQAGRGAAASLALVFLLLMAISLLAPVNHDESQYLAAAKLAERWRPFADFLYLQTPLQIYLFAPIAEAAAPYSFLALRLVTALIGSLTILLVFASQRLAGVGRATALLAALLLFFCHSFQFGAVLVRNDALPALLETGGIACAIAALRSSEGRSLALWGAAGLLFGGAVSAKISYLLPTAALGLFHLIRCVRATARHPVRDALACLAGVAIGLLPALLARHSAPDAFDYGVLHYARHAPWDWYGYTGDENRLGLASKLADTGKSLLSGPAAPVLVWLGWRRWVNRGRGEAAHPAQPLLDLLILAGLAAALAPTPTWQQYLVPLLPPLFTAFGLELSRQPAAGGERTGLAAILFLFAAIGLVQPARWAASDAFGPVGATREAHWIGEMIRRSGGTGDIATLAPHIAIDSGFPIDRRFATGPFFYRTGDRFSPDRQRRLNAVSPGTTGLFLDTAPPAAIVTGYEADSRGVDLERALRDYARTRGYRLELSPSGRTGLYVAPAAAHHPGTSVVRGVP